MRIDDSNFMDNYINPDVYPLTHITCQFTIEYIKIVAAKIFLELLSQHYLSHSSKVTSQAVYQAVILAPLREEIVFRGIILRIIHWMQNSLNQFEDKDLNIEEGKQSQPSFCIRLRSHFFDDSAAQDADSETFIIDLYPPVFGEIFCQAVLQAIYWPQKKWNQYWGSELSAKEEKAQLQQIFRIHLAAFIFAAAHLSNTHSNKAIALTQLVWSYMGGVIYGYLSEKYHSLAPSILAHGFNNAIATSMRVYPERVSHLLLALFANRLGSYLLGNTSVDKTIMSGVAQAYECCVSLPERVVQWYRGNSAAEEVQVI